MHIFDLLIVVILFFFSLSPFCSSSSLLFLIKYDLSVWCIYVYTPPPVISRNFNCLTSQVAMVNCSLQTTHILAQSIHLNYYILHAPLEDQDYCCHI